MKLENYEARKRELMSDVSVSDYLKRQIVIAENRDILDMLNDVELLRDLLKSKFEEAVSVMRGNIV